MIGRHMMSVVPVARVSLSKICLVRRIQVFPPWSVQSSVRWFMFLPVRLQVQEPSLIPVPVPAPAALPAVGLPRIRVVLLPVPAVVRLPVRVVRAVLLPVPAQAQAMMPQDGDGSIPVRVVRAVLLPVPAQAQMALLPVPVQVPLPTLPDQMRRPLLQVVAAPVQVAARSLARRGRVRMGGPVFRRESVCRPGAGRPPSEAFPSVFPDRCFVFCRLS